MNDRIEHKQQLNQKILNIIWKRCPIFFPKNETTPRLPTVGLLRLVMELKIMGTVSFLDFTLNDALD